MTATTPPKFNYNVSVNADGSFTITPLGDAPESPISVTVPNTTITYTLSDDTGSNVAFEAPLISNDPNDNLAWQITNSGRSIVITDNDLSAEDSICVKLVLKLISPDPQIQNKPV
ncbi:hypothetical protein D210916BOD24_09640 [Alteromonas sp. D210916BOD_24]|uniref:DP-EP family protein n=1 Tax=Alteromonas sp. D210916BOD_24 TaxID=3157618 RepID=UPI00399C9C07